MSDIIRIKKGLTINLEGKAEKILVKAEQADFYAVKPTDFHGITPKMVVKVDDPVKVGSVLFYDKNKPEVKFTSPVSGTIHAVNRGERRQILDVVIKSGNTSEYENFLKADASTLSREQIIENILNSGLWPALKQRPYDIIANPENKPKAIFISAFDTAPLAPDLDFIVKGCEHDFQCGINALLKLTSGKVHVNTNSDYPASTVYTSAKGIQLNEFQGPHPSGNVGIQIHHIDPINKGEVVWVINPQDVIAIGRLFEQGIYDASRIIALAGSEVEKPKYLKVIAGSSIESILKGHVGEGNFRIISGNILSGTKVNRQGFLGYYDSIITIIPEGNQYEFLGWATPGFKKFSFSRSFFSWLTPSKSYTLDTNLHGGLRAYVLTGQYEKVFPMDILPVHLVKAVIANDIDRMEQLGIYEVAPEDFALCEFVCTSKIDVQEIIRNGLDSMMKEMN